MKNRTRLSALIVSIFLAAVSCAQAADVPLQRSTPEAQGISSQAIGDFVQAAEKINTLHSFMIVRHGQVIAEAWWKPEAPDKLHKLASLTKSFISTAVGLAIWEKLLPAFQAEALPVNATAQENLKKLLSKLEAHPAKKAK